MTCVSQEAVTGWDAAAKSSIGTTAVQLTTDSACFKGVLVKASPSNSGTVYIGPSDVTANSADATDGYPLGAGEDVFIPIDNPSLVYAIGSGAGQKVFFMIA